MLRLSASGRSASRRAFEWLSPLGSLGAAGSGGGSACFRIRPDPQVVDVFIYNISDNQPVELTTFFELVLVWNKGVSYGLFSGHQQGFLIAMALVISALLWAWAAARRIGWAPGRLA